MTGIVNYGTFITAGILLNLTPGVDTLYILTRSCTGGRRIGVASALGISTGILFHLTLVSLGLAAVLASAPSAFFALKCLGAGYLFYLGVKAFRDGGSALGGAAGRDRQASLLRSWRDGALTNALNPKVALFFLAFLPAFVAPGAESSPVPFLLLGLTFLATSTVWNVILAVLAGSLLSALTRSPKARLRSARGSGLIYWLLGLGVLASRPS